MKRRHLLAALVAVVLPLLTSSPAAAGWEGIWETRDQYGSVFYFVVNPDGTALSYYGDGIPGTWETADTDATRIIWENGRKDYLFNGIMGMQRISLPVSGDVKEGPIFNMGIRRVEAIPEDE